MIWRSDRRVLLLLVVGFTLVIGLLVAADRSALDAMETFGHESIGRARSFLMVALVLALTIAGATSFLANRLFRQVEWQGRELARLSAHMLETQEATVTRFSRELHDQFGQTLSAIEANLVALDARQHPREIGGRIEDCIGLVQDVISQAREMSQLLRPSILDDFGLSASLEWLAEGVAQRTGLSVKYASTFDGRVRHDIETHLFRIAQEALTNSVRHARASEVHMLLHQQNGELTLTIADNGSGMEGPVPKPRGLGLISMRARAQQVSAQLTIQSEPRKGTTIIVRVPVPAPAPVYATPNPHPAG